MEACRIMRARQSQSRNQEGFTLVEIVIVVALFAILIFAFLGLYDDHGKLFNFENGVIRTSGGNRQALNEMRTLVLQSKLVLASRTFSGTVYTSGPSTMILQIPSIDASNNVIAGTWDYAVFYASGTRLYRILEANASSVRKSNTKLLSDTLSAVTFTYNSTDFAEVNTVDVDLTSQLQVRNQSVSSHEQLKLYLRNH